MPAARRSPFQYAVIRVVPRVEREECFNAGVVLLCRPRHFLGARVGLDEELLTALAPDLSPTAAEVRSHLDAVVRIAAGDVASGPIARLSQPQRFHWLSAPSSTIIQPGPVHTGMCDDPVATLEHLFTTLVARPRRERGDVH